MMFPTSIYALGALVLALAACGAAVTPDVPTDPVTGLSCGLHLTERAGQVQVVAQVQSVSPISGQYSLHIGQSGGAGQNGITQSGDFTALAGQAVDLGSATLSGSAAQIDAHLTLATAAGTLACPVTLD